MALKSISFILVFVLNLIEIHWTDFQCNLFIKEKRVYKSIMTLSINILFSRIFSRRKFKEFIFFIFSTTHGSGIRIYIVVVLNQIEKKRRKKRIYKKGRNISYTTNSEYTKRNSQKRSWHKGNQKKKTRTTRKHDPIWYIKDLGCKF